MDIVDETQILKTLDRLTYFANKSTPLESISPFYHAVPSFFTRRPKLYSNTLIIKKISKRNNFISSLFIHSLKSLQ